MNNQKNQTQWQPQQQHHHQPPSPPSPHYQPTATPAPTPASGGPSRTRQQARRSRRCNRATKRRWTRRCAPRRWPSSSAGDPLSPAALEALLCLENRKPARDARLFDCGFLVAAFRYFGALVAKLPSQFYDRGR